MNEQETAVLHLDAIAARIESSLKIEASASSERVAEQVMVRAQRRTQIDDDIKALEEHIAGLRFDFRRLPRLPDLRQTAWAQAVLAMPNLLVMEIDTTGLGDDNDITRIVLVDNTGSITMDLLVNPAPRMIEPGASQASGLVSSDLADKPSLDDIWPTLMSAFRGYYVVSYAQDFDRRMLTNAASHHGLPAIALVGDDLQGYARAYFEDARASLGALCARIGHALPSPATGPQRAMAQYRVLKAIADVWRPGKTEEDDDDDEHPF